MFYRLIGMAVVKGVKLFLRRRYGPTYAPKPLIAGGIVVVAIGVLLFAAKRENLSLGR